MDEQADRKALLEMLLRMGQPNLANARFRVEGLTKGEFFLLDHLYEHRQRMPQAKGMYVSELAELMGVSPPAASRMLRFMEKKDYIQRVVDSADRRNTYVLLCRVGEDAHAAMQCRALEFTGRVVDRIGPEDTVQLLALMTRLMNIVHEEIAKGI